MKSFLIFFKIAFDQLKRNKGRAFLTMLGVIIGVASVVLLVAIGNGLKFYIQEQLESLGANSIYIMPGQVFEKGRYRSGSDFSAFSGAKFDENDWRRLTKIEGVAGVAPLVSKSAVVSFKDKEVLIEVIGTTTDFLKVRNLSVEKGRFFTKSEEKRGTKVVVLGFQVAEDLFPRGTALGKRVTIEEEKYQVIGIMEKIGGLAGASGGFDNRVYLPYPAVFRLIGEKKFPFFILSADSKELLPQVKRKTEAVLLERYKDEDFSLVDQAEILAVVNNVLGMVTLGLVGIAAISLLVGGVGIMNIMFVSVTERIKEIGLRKAVGATKKDILYQFLSEAVAISLTGGAVGVMVSFVSVFLLNHIFPARITFWSVGLAFSVCVLVGIVFGVGPARRAANLSPIEALRYE